MLRCISFCESHTKNHMKTTNNIRLTTVEEIVKCDLNDPKSIITSATECLNHWRKEGDIDWVDHSKVRLSWRRIEND